MRAMEQAIARGNRAGQLGPGHRQLSTWVDGDRCGKAVTTTNTQGIVVYALRVRVCTPCD